MEKSGGRAQNQCIEHILFLLCNSGTCQVGGVVSKLETFFVLVMSQGGQESVCPQCCNQPRGLPTFCTFLTF